MKNPTLIGTAAACLMAAAFAAPAWSAPSDGMKSVSQLQPVWRTDVTGSRTEVVPLMKLVPGGSAAAVKLTGLSRVQAFDFGVRRDEVVSEATLDLSFTPSPALAPSGSQINFYLNGRLQSRDWSLRPLRHTAHSLRPDQQLHPLTQPPGVCVCVCVCVCV